MRVEWSKRELKGQSVSWIVKIWVGHRLLFYCPLIHYLEAWFFNCNEKTWPRHPENSVSDEPGFAGGFSTFAKKKWKTWSHQQVSKIFTIIDFLFWGACEQSLTCRDQYLILSTLNDYMITRLSKKSWYIYMRTMRFYWVLMMPAKSDILKISVLISWRRPKRATRVQSFQVFWAWQR